MKLWDDFLCSIRKKFVYDPQNSDHRYAFMHLQDVVLFYRSDEERLAFEVYIEGHQNLLSDKISEITRFDHISTCLLYTSPSPRD